MENLDLVYAFFNQYMFGEVQTNIDLIEHYYQTNPATMGNRLIDELLGAIRKYPFESLDEPLFQSILSKTGKNAAESQMIIGEIRKWKQFDKVSMQPARDYLHDVIASEQIRIAGVKFKDRPQEYLQYMRTLPPITTGSGGVVSTMFKDIDKNAIMAEINQEGFQSPFDWINNTYEPYHQIPAGQIFMVAATPGTGKSLFVTHSSLYHAFNGIPTHVTFLGDLNMADVQARYAASYSGRSFGDAKLKFAQIYDEISRTPVADNLALTVEPSGVLNIDEYVEFILNSPYKICFLDYDANLSKKGLLTSNGGLFEYFEYIYEALTKLSASGRLVYVCSQIKSSFLRDGQLDEASISGSRRKIEIVDACLTLTQNRDSVNDLCIFKMVKNRRGRPNDMIYAIRLGSGRFRDIPRGVYDQISMLQERREFSDMDIDQMIDQWRRNLQMVQQQAPATLGIQKQDTILNPFDKRKR